MMNMSRLTVLHCDMSSVKILLTITLDTHGRYRFTPSWRRTSPESETSRMNCGFTPFGSTLPAGWKQISRYYYSRSLSADGLPVDTPCSKNYRRTKSHIAAVGRVSVIVSQRNMLIGKPLCGFPLLHATQLLFIGETLRGKPINQTFLRLTVLIVLISHEHAFCAILGNSYKGAFFDREASNLLVSGLQSGDVECVEIMFP
ncbi:hypothetical protein Tco_0231952 [Tanacetum coccineum]